MSRRGRTQQKEYITSVTGTQVVDNYSRFDLEALGSFCIPDRREDVAFWVSQNRC